MVDRSSCQDNQIVTDTRVDGAVVHRLEDQTVDVSALKLRLATLGVSREVKRQVLRDLERAGLITVDRRDRKSVVVTLCAL